MLKSEDGGAYGLLEFADMYYNGDGIQQDKAQALKIYPPSR
jgi:TPR repeat protein